MDNVISNNSLRSLTVNRAAFSRSTAFSKQVKPVPTITNQKSSGRCWLFAALNVFRRKMMKDYDLSPSFELSQNYMFFHDKYERFQYNLRRVYDTRELPLDSREVQHLLKDPMCDGGQWDMVVNLVEKYGVVPKDCYKETHHSSNSREMNAIFVRKFREFSLKVRSCDDSTIESTIADMMKDVRALLVKFLGEPPVTVDWYYNDKNDNYHEVLNVSPVDFFTEYVSMSFDDYVCLIDDPRKCHPKDKCYTVKYLGNVEGGRAVRYLNVDIDVMKTMVKKSIDTNEAVWFGCDVGKHLNGSDCAMDLDLVDYSVLDTRFPMDKEQRVLTGDSLMTHAMVFSGYRQKNGQEVDLWEVENSWDTKGPNKGYYSMTTDWFDEYMYEVVVRKEWLDDAMKDVWDNDDPTVLVPWDPMGSLA